MASGISVMATPEELEALVLTQLADSQASCIEDSLDFAAEKGCDHEALQSAIRSMVADEMLQTEVRDRSYYRVSADGREVRCSAFLIAGMQGL